MTRWFMLAATASLALAACTVTETPVQPNNTAGPAIDASASSTRTANPQMTGTAQADLSEPAMDGCNRAKARGFLSAEPTAAMKAQIAKAVGDRPIRYYAEGDVITMDFSPDRLNVVLGGDGRIIEFRCG